MLYGSCNTKIQKYVEKPAGCSELTGTLISKQVDARAHHFRCPPHPEFKTKTTVDHSEKEKKMGSHKHEDQGHHPRRGKTRVQPWRQNKYKLVEERQSGHSRQGESTPIHPYIHSHVQCMHRPGGEGETRSGFLCDLLFYHAVHTLATYCTANVTMPSSGLSGNLATQSLTLSLER